MLRFSLLLLAAATAALPVAAHSHKKAGLEIVHPWTPATAKDAVSARVYMTVRNGSGRPDRLVSASTPRAGKVEFRAGGKGVPGVAVAKDAELGFYGDGPSLVLSGLKQPLFAYDDFEMILVFEKAGRIPVVVMVEEGK
jgi:copper(I)-binding protein